MAEWTDQEYDRAIDLNSAGGRSANDIAKVLSLEFGREFTRCMVLGKLNRNGVRSVGNAMFRSDNRIRNSLRRAKPPRLGFASSVSTPIPKDADPLPVEEQWSDKLYALIHDDEGLQLPDNGCRWFFGDPLIDPVGYCGKTQVLGKQYCEHHVGKVFYVPVVQPRATSLPPDDQPVNFVPERIPEMVE